MPPFITVPARLARPFAGIYGDVDFLQRRHVLEGPFYLRISSVRRDGPRRIPAKGHGEGIFPGKRTPHCLDFAHIIIGARVVAEGAPPQTTVVARPASHKIIICGMDPGDPADGPVGRLEAVPRVAVTGVDSS